jgi:hypothetical protein
MIVTIDGTLNNIYKSADFRNKETGEVKEGKMFAQLMVDAKSYGVAKKELIDIPVSGSSVNELQNKDGQIVSIKCDISSKAQIYYGAI